MHGPQVEVEMELLDRDRILAALTPTARVRPSRLDVHRTLDSTNSYLLNKVGADWPSGAICLAEQQQAGRGRQRRSWQTPFGASLAFSLLWRFNQHPEALSGLSLATGIAVARTLRDFGATEVGLKWPNDVWWHGRKLGGILLESGGNPGDFHVVAGVGLNLAMPPQFGAAIDQPWVNLREILGTVDIARNRLAARLISELLETFAGFEHGGFADLTTEWAGFDQIAGRQVRLMLPQMTVIGIARGVDATGALLLETADGRIRPCIGGEISLRLEP